MKMVFLTVGPRGAGKSSYCLQVVERHPHVGFISRDQILIETFGKTELSPYEGGHEYAREIFLRKVRVCLSSKNENSLTLLDYWTGFPQERRVLIEHLRNCGAERISAWYFITPLETCLQWFMQKEESIAYHQNEWMKDIRRNGCERDFHLFHKLAADINDDGFDDVVEINPCQLTFPGFSLV